MPPRVGQSMTARRCAWGCRLLSRYVLHGSSIRNEETKATVVFENAKTAEMVHTFMLFAEAAAFKRAKEMAAKAVEAERAKMGERWSLDSAYLAQAIAAIRALRDEVTL